MFHPLAHCIIVMILYYNFFSFSFGFSFIHSFAFALNANSFCVCEYARAKQLARNFILQTECERLNEKAEERKRRTNKKSYDIKWLYSQFKLCRLHSNSMRISKKQNHIFWCCRDLWLTFARMWISVTRIFIIFSFFWIHSFRFFHFLFVRVWVYASHAMIKVVYISIAPCANTWTNEPERRQMLHKQKKEKTFFTGRGMNNRK